MKTTFRISRRSIAIAIGSFLAGILIVCSLDIVTPGNVGIRVNLGKVSEGFLEEGLHLKCPFVCSIQEISLRHTTESFKTACFSSNLQTVEASVSVRYHVPQESAILIYRNYSGKIFENLIQKSAEEALKEVSAKLTAEEIVKQREMVKQLTLASLQKKVGSVLAIEDFILSNVDLSKDLENAIEQKMVKEQQAEQAKYDLAKAKIDADTAIAKANGEATAISIRGEALSKNPSILQLQIVEKWNGQAPQVVSGTGSSGISMLLPSASK